MNQIKYYSRFLIIVLTVSVLNIYSADNQSAQPAETQKASVIPQRLFASPDEAVKALQVATEAKDKVALNEIFGPDVKELLTGDAVQDAKNAQKFANLLAQGYTLVKEGDDTIIIEAGPNDHWPMPIPLTKANGQWYFNTSAGKEEIINRHIGKDELHAIGVCRAYVLAQQEFANINPNASTNTNYAKKFESTPGKTDGLYWSKDVNEKESPFGLLVSKANTDSYNGNKNAKPQPFHGYYFKILTRQGKAAPDGKMNYMEHGKLTKGFGLVAYPAHWDQSGIMSFIVNQKGQVFEKNLCEKSARIARDMNEYNPDSEWSLVKDNGVLNVVLEK